jgi:hypothetical protein
MSVPHLHRDWAHTSHICTGTGLTRATSAPSGPCLNDRSVAHEQGKKIHVYVDETRPLLQVRLRIPALYVTAHVVCCMLYALSSLTFRRASCAVTPHCCFGEGTPRVGVHAVLLYVVSCRPRGTLHVASSARINRRVVG